MELHWLSAVNRVDLKVATLVFCCLHDLAPPYLSSSLHRVADMDSRRRLRSPADTVTHRTYTLTLPLAEDTVLSRPATYEVPLCTYISS